MRASGTAGALRVSYQVAADLGAWEIVLAPRLPRVFTFSGTVLREHTYWITQAPLDLVLSLGSSEWLWRGVTVTRAGDKIHIELTERPIVSERAPTAPLATGRKQS